MFNQNQRHSLEESSTWQHYALAIMVAILLLGTATRLFQLEIRSLWADEGWTLVLAEGPTIPDIVQRLANDQHPPLYFIFIHLWRDVAGDTEFALRMLSALTGVIAIACMYQLGKSLSSPLTGVLAALLLSIWDHHIDLSQDVRHYSQLATLMIMSTWFYMAFYNSKNPSRFVRIGYVLSAIVLLYTHYLGGFVLICHAVHMLFFMRPTRKLFWGVFHFGAVCFGFLPWFPIVIIQNKIRWETPLYYLNSLPNSSETYLMVRDAVLGQQYALYVVLMLVPLWGYKSFFIQFRQWVLVLGWGFGFFVLTYYLNSNPSREFLTIRNFIIMTPAVLLLIANGLAHLQPNLRALLVMVIIATSLTTIDTRQLKPPWHETVQNISRFYGNNEPVLMDIWVGDFPERYYVEQQLGSDTPWLSLREARDTYTTQFLPVLKGYIEEYDAFWLVFWKSIPVDDMPYADIFTQAGYQRTATLSVDHVGNTIYSYRYDQVQDENISIYYNQDNEALIALNRYEYPENVSAGEDLNVQLLFMGLETLSLDYSVSVFMLDTATGAVVSAHDSPPLNGNSPTSQWNPDQIIFDQHSLRLPNEIPSGTYEIGVKIYHYLSPEAPLVICENRANCEWTTLGEVRVE